jgi:hypothetical protein
MPINQPVFVRIDRALYDKLDEISRRSHRQKRDVISFCLEKVQMTPEGGLTFDQSARSAKMG